MSDPPAALDPLLLNHWLWWKLKCFEAQGTEFQQLFERVMKRGGDESFTAVRPYGNIGDKKNDGMYIQQGTIYAVYSPDEYKQADLVSKVESDFEGAVEYWKDDLERWVFVYNVRRGLPPDVAGILTKLRKSTEVELDSMSSDDLWQRVRDLPITERCEILGAPAGYEHLFLASEEGDLAERLQGGAFVVIQDVLSPINIADAAAALSPRQPFGPPLRTRPDIPTDTATNWAAAGQFQAELVDEAIRRARDLLPRFAVFSLSPIPLAVQLGYLLSDRVEVEPYQYDRDRHTWAWLIPEAVDNDINAPEVQDRRGGSGDAVIRVSLSASISHKDTEVHVPDPVVEVDITVPDPDVMWLKSPSQLGYVSASARNVLKTLRNRGEIDRIHLFIAAPTGACVRWGQAINPNMNPPVLLYEFGWRQTPRYRHTITLQ